MNYLADEICIKIYTNVSVSQIHRTVGLQDKYVIGPICLISSRTEMSDVARQYYVYSESDIYMFGPMKCFSKQDRMSYEVPQSFADTAI